MKKKFFVEVDLDIIAFEGAGILCLSGDYQGREWEELLVGD